MVNTNKIPFGELANELMAEVFLISLSVVSSLLFIQISNKVQQLVREKQRYVGLVFVIIVLGSLDLYISSKALIALMHHLTQTRN